MVLQQCTELPISGHSGDTFYKSGTQQKQNNLKQTAILHHIYAFTFMGNCTRNHIWRCHHGMSTPFAFSKRSRGLIYSYKAISYLQNGACADYRYTLHLYTFLRLDVFTCTGKLYLNMHEPDHFFLYIPAARIYWSRKESQRMTKEQNNTLAKQSDHHSIKAAAW